MSRRARYLYRVEADRENRPIGDHGHGVTIARRKALELATRQGRTLYIWRRILPDLDHAGPVGWKCWKEARPDGSLCRVKETKRPRRSNAEIAREAKARKEEE